MKFGKIKTHFGIYGICLQNSKILCITKNRGPYKNRFDLPGGSQEYNESLVETLYREIKEETGREVNNEKSLVTLDFFVEEKNNFIVHHIAVLFRINISNNQLDIPNIVNDGINDSLGCTWVNIKELNIANSSPVILEALKYLKDGKIEKRSVYTDWKVL